MNSIQKLTAFLYIIAAILVVLFIIGVLVYYWYVKVKKPSMVDEEQVDYSELNRRDSADYMKFDTIEDDMIIRQNGYLYEGIIKCQGFDYYTAQASERKRAHDGYLSLINTITKGLTYRQYTKKEDLDDTKEHYEKAYKKIEEELYYLSKDYDTVLTEYTDVKNNGTLDDTLEIKYLDTLEKMNSDIEVLEWERFHLQDNIQYIDDVSSMTAPETVETYIFSWKYEPLIGSRDLSDEEIHKKAKRELGRIGNSYIHALSNAGVRAYRVGTDELRQMMRRHWHPLTANIFKLKDVLDSNFFDDITSAEAMTDADYEYAEQEGTIDAVMQAREELEDAGKSVESMTYEDLLAYSNHAGDIVEDDETRISDDEIDKRKNLLYNAFKERDEQRKKEEEEFVKNIEEEKLRRKAAGLSEEKKIDNKVNKLTNMKIEFGILGD